MWRTLCAMVYLEFYPVEVLPYILLASSHLLHPSKMEMKCIYTSIF